MEEEHNDDRRNIGILTLEDGPFLSYKIVKSKRRTMALQVSKKQGK
ncbi:hypothetical protein [Lacrimispora xylanisolvens]